MDLAEQFCVVAQPCAGGRFCAPADGRHANSIARIRKVATQCEVEVDAVLQEEIGCPDSATARGISCALGIEGAEEVADATAVALPSEGFRLGGLVGCDGQFVLLVSENLLCGQSRLDFEESAQSDVSVVGDGLITQRGVAVDVGEDAATLKDGLGDVTRERPNAEVAIEQITKLLRDVPPDAVRLIWGKNSFFEARYSR